MGRLRSERRLQRRLPATSQITIGDTRNIRRQWSDPALAWPGTPGARLSAVSAIVSVSLTFVPTGTASGCFCGDCALPLHGIG